AGPFHECLERAHVQTAGIVDDKQAPLSLAHEGIEFPGQRLGSVNGLLLTLIERALGPPSLPLTLFLFREQGPNLLAALGATQLLHEGIDLQAARDVSEGPQVIAGPIL